TNNYHLDQDTLTYKYAYDFRRNGVQVWQCDSQGFGVPGKFCCESTAEKTRCCSTPDAIFGPLIAATPGNAAAVQTYNITAASFSATPTPTPALAADATSSQTITSESQATPGGLHASSPTGLNGTDNNGEISGGGEGIGKAVRVGLGIGCSVGGVVLVFLGIIWWRRRQRLQRYTTEQEKKSTAGQSDVRDSGNLTQLSTGKTYAGKNASNYDGRWPVDYNGRGPINSMATFSTIRTVSSWGTGTYALTADPEVVTRASSDYDGSPAGVLGHYQMAEIGGKETLASPT
ncbi:hypothetical protein LY76DRAFT_676178, partial [Colletotrichum caudatum]